MVHMRGYLLLKRCTDFGFYPKISLIFYKVLLAKNLLTFYGAYHTNCLTLLSLIHPTYSAVSTPQCHIYATFVLKYAGIPKYWYQTGIFLPKNLSIRLVGERWYNRRGVMWKIFWRENVSKGQKFVLRGRKYKIIVVLLQIHQIMINNCQSEELIQSLQLISG